MMRAIQLAVACFALLFTTAGQVRAGMITVGSFTFDDSALADTASVAQGSVSPFPSGSVLNLVDGDFNTSVAPSGSGSVIRFGFTDNTLVNGSGIDLLVFEGFSAVENTDISLTLNGATLRGTFIETLGGSNPNNPSNSQVNTFGFDLSGLGVASGAQVSGDLFIRPGGSSSPDLFEIAAINSAAPVPEPSSLTLLGIGACVGGIGAARRRRREKQQEATA